MPDLPFGRVRRGGGLYWPCVQQSLSNFVSGLLISTAKPFAEGDRVKLRDIGVTAIAESVTILYRKLRTFDNSLIGSSTNERFG